jgi:competence protein ComEA|tara:strand:- start:235 stop:867 length:633 start_codon:yes stop_codon:yes gene_type:complete
VPDEVQPDPIRNRIQEILFERPPTRQRIIGGVALLVVTFSVVVLARTGSSDDPVDVIPFVTVPPTSISEPADVLVHVAGAVASPGLYRMASTDRVADLIDAAGGPLSVAVPDMLNLAAPLTDGSRVWVPSESDMDDPMPQEPAQAGDPTINVNSATPSQLEQLPGVGPSLAASIVEYRSRAGPFRAVDDLLSVPGIGPAKLAGFRDRVTL